MADLKYPIYGTDKEGRPTKRYQQDEYKSTTWRDPDWCWSCASSSPLFKYRDYVICDLYKCRKAVDKHYEEL